MRLLESRRQQARGVVFMMPQWAAPSEVWAQRLIVALEPEVAAVATLNPAERSWRGRRPAFPLNDLKPALWRRVARRVGLRYRVREHAFPTRRLRQLVSRPTTLAVLVNYLDFALRFEDVWNATETPLFVHCHGYDVTWDLRSHENPGRRTFPPEYLDGVRRLSRRATLIANSTNTLQRLLDLGIPENRVRLKYLGVPVPSTSPDPRRDSSQLTVLYLGRLVDFKGPDVVIRAFELARRRGFGGRLIIAGDGPLRVTCELLRATSTSRDDIQMLGAVDAATGEALLQQADIFTAHNRPGPLTHQEEALGVSILEAMASGLPVISGRSGGVLETVLDGVTGILVPPGDVDAHAEAFIALGSDPERRASLGRAGWQRVAAHFSAESERVQIRQLVGLATGAS